METSSESPLQTVGAYQYLDHPSTRALMLAWHEIGTPERPSLWCEGDPIPLDFCEHVRQGCLFSGWNVNFFDRIAYQKLLVMQFGFPPIPDDNWVDSMHRAAAANLPRSLDGAAKAVGVTFDEDKKDNTRIRRITNAAVTPIPALVSDILAGRAPEAATRRTAPNLTLLDDMGWLAARCIQDVTMEESVLLALPEWPQVEPWRFMPHIDRRVNDRGILLDVALAEGMATAAKIETARLDVEMNKLTNGAVTSTTVVEALKRFLVNRGVDLPSTVEPDEDDDDEDEAETYKVVSRKSPWRLRKSDIADLIARKDVPEDCRLALMMRAEAAKASVRKLRAMLACASADGRLRGMLSLMGAQATGRWCLAEGSLVLVRTVSGDVLNKPIENVRSDDKVWDGHVWVAHDGVVFSGVKHVIWHDNVLATPEHQVYVSDTEKISLEDARVRQLPLYRGSKRFELHGLSVDFPEREVIFRTDTDDASQTLVVTYNAISSERKTTSYSRRYSEIWSGNILHCDDCQRSYQGRSTVLGTELHRVVLYDRSDSRLQFEQGRRNTAEGTHAGVLANAATGSRCTCSVSATFERGLQEQRASCSAATRTHSGQSPVAGRKPWRDVCPGYESVDGLQKMARSASRQNISQEKRVSDAVRISRTQRAYVNGNGSYVAGANTRTEISNLRCYIQKTNTLSSRPSSKEGNDASFSGSTNTHRSRETQTTTKRSTSGLLDTRASCGTGPANERGRASQTDEKTQVVKTYDILNAGPRNRFLANGRIVSNSAGKAQLHNMVRDKFASFDDVATRFELDPKADRDQIKRLMPQELRRAIEAGRTGDADLLRRLYEAPRKDMQGRVTVQGVLPWISRMMRRTLSAPAGQLLLNGDFANIEARIPVWLAGQEETVQQFARGEDLYRIAAAPVYGLEPSQLTSEQRQIGKVMRLFLGFMGGVNAFVPAAMNYGIAISREDGLVFVKTFRETNKTLVDFADANLQAARWAIMYPGQEFFVPPKGLVSWILRDNCLMTRLPSGRYLRYWSPRLEQGTWPDGNPKQHLDVTVLVVKGRAIFRRALWRGLALENQVQAIAADMLGVALDNMDRNGLPVVLHVHDSVAAEQAEDRAEAMLPIFQQCMLDQPAWATGLPVAVDATADTRFG